MARILANTREFLDAVAHIHPAGARAVPCRLSSAQSPPESEIERKFPVTPLIREAVLHRAAGIVAHKNMVDVYYDDAQYRATTRDTWLRQRNQDFEIKWAMEKESAQGLSAKGSLAGIDYYMESTSFATIAEVLHRVSAITVHGPLPAHSHGAHGWLTGSGMHPFATIATQRERYRLQFPVLPTSSQIASSHEVNVDIDSITYSGPEVDQNGLDRRHYHVGEVELVRAGGGMHPSAALFSVFSQLGIPHCTVRGKVLEYLVRFRPHHYRALEKCGLIAAKLR